MSRTVIPPAYSEMIMSSRPPSAARALRHQPRLERPARSRGTSSGTGPTSVATVFGVRAVARVRRTPPGRVALLIAQMLGQLGRQPPLQHRLDHLRQEPALTGQRQLPSRGPRHHLIEQSRRHQLPHHLPGRRIRQLHRHRLIFRHGHLCTPFDLVHRPSDRLLPADAAAAVYTRLDRIARRAPATDIRGMDARRADALVMTVLAGTTGAAALPPADSAASSTAATSTRPARSTGPGGARCGSCGAVHGGLARPGPAAARRRARHRPRRHRPRVERPARRADRTRPDPRLDGPPPHRRRHLAAGDGVDPAQRHRHRHRPRRVHPLRGARRPGPRPRPHLPLPRLPPPRPPRRPRPPHPLADRPHRPPPTWSRSARHHHRLNPNTWKVEATDTPDCTGRAAPPPLHHHRQPAGVVRSPSADRRLVAANRSAGSRSPEAPRPSASSSAARTCALAAARDR